jgi:hypothetical protein
MNALLWSVIGVVAALAWAEGREWLPSMSKWLIRRAVGYLPEGERDRMLEELLAEVSVIPGKISPAVFACSLWWSLARSSLIAAANVKLSAPLMRLLDITASALLLLYCVFVTFTMIVALLMRGDQVLRRERRIGLDGPFDVLTFNVDSESAFGRFSHCAGLDELPTLVNVLRGDMSLVGPPPLDPTASDGQLPKMRPGVLWTDDLPEECWDEFGSSLAVTTRLYFAAAWSGLLALLVTRRR